MRGDEAAHAGSPRWHPVEGPRAYAAVLEQIEEHITRGDLRVGDRLPAERDFAELLGVSRPAVREAIRALEAQGVVRSGAGRDGGTTVVGSTSASLTRFLRMHVALVNFPMADIVDARVMLERESVALAARNRDDPTLAALREVVEAMEEPGIDRRDFNAHDTRLHVAIAQAGGNRLVADITTALRASMEAPILASFHAMPDWDGVVAELRRGHRAILEAVADRDPAAASDAVEAHIRYAFSTLDYSRAD